MKSPQDQSAIATECIQAVSAILTRHGIEHDPLTMEIGIHGCQRSEIGPELVERYESATGKYWFATAIWKPVSFAYSKLTLFTNDFPEPPKHEKPF